MAINMSVINSIYNQAERSVAGSTRGFAYYGPGSKPRKSNLTLAAQATYRAYQNGTIFMERPPKAEVVALNVLSKMVAHSCPRAFDDFLRCKAAISSSSCSKSSNHPSVILANPSADIVARAGWEFNENPVIAKKFLNLTEEEIKDEMHDALANKNCYAAFEYANMIAFRPLPKKDIREIAQEIASFQTRNQIEVLKDHHLLWRVSRLCINGESNKAELVAAMISTVREKNAALFRIAQENITRGNLNEAERIAYQIPYDTNKIFIFAQIAGEHFCTGHMADFQRFIQLFTREPNAHFRTLGFRLLIDCFVNRDNYDQIDNFAQILPSRDLKDELFSRIAIRNVSGHRLPEAERFANLIVNPRLKGDVMWQINIRQPFKALYRGGVKLVKSVLNSRVTKVSFFALGTLAFSYAMNFASDGYLEE